MPTWRKLVFSAGLAGIMDFMAKYPIFMELGGRRVVVVGGGAVAVRKAEVLLGAGARLVVVALKPSDASNCVLKRPDVWCLRRWPRASW